MSFLRKKVQSEVALFFSISRFSIGQSLALISGEDFVRILYHSRDEIKNVDNDALDSSESRIKSTLGLALDRLSKKGVAHLNFLKLKNKHISHIEAVFEPPVLITKKIIKSTKFDKSTLITKKIIDDIIDQAETDFFKYFKEQKNNTDGLRILEKIVVESSINGYTVTKCVGKRASDLQISIIFTAISEKLYALIGESVYNHFHANKNIVARGSFFVSAEACRGLVANSENFVFMNVGHDMSQIVVIKDGTVFDVADIDIGFEQILKQIQVFLGVPREVCISYLKMFSSQTLERSIEEKTKRQLDEYAANSSRKFFDAVANLSNSCILPHSFYVVASSDIGLLASSLVDQLKKSVDNGPLFKYTIIKPSNFGSNITRSAESDSDALLSMSAIVYNNNKVKN